MEGALIIGASRAAGRNCAGAPIRASKVNRDNCVSEASGVDIIRKANNASLAKVGTQQAWQAFTQSKICQDTPVE